MKKIALYRDFFFLSKLVKEVFLKRCHSILNSDVKMESAMHTLGRENSRCRGPEAGTSLASLRSCQRPVLSEWDEPEAD